VSITYGKGVASKSPLSQWSRDPSLQQFVLGVRLVLLGRIKPDAPWLSDDQAVADYRAEYRRRYQHFLRTGNRES